MLLLRLINNHNLVSIVQQTCWSEFDYMGEEAGFFDIRPANNTSQLLNYNFHKTQ